VVDINLNINHKLVIHDESAASIIAAITRLERKLMAKSDEITASVTALNSAFKEATDELARDLDALRKQVTDGLAGGLTADEATALQTQIDTQLGAARDRLIELGKDPANPIPVIR